MQLFGPLLDDCKTAGEEAEKIGRECFAKMLERRGPTEIEWMSRILRQCLDLSKRCGLAALADLRERIEHINLEELPDLLRTSMVDIMKTLGASGVQQTPKKEDP